MFTRLLTAAFVVSAFPASSWASPNPFGATKEECIKISNEKYEQNSDYIQEQLLSDETPLLNAAQDIHKIELQTCATSMFF